MKLNTKFTVITMLVFMLLLGLAVISVTSAPSEQLGAKIDKLRFKVVNPLDAQVRAMMNGEIDVLTDLVKSSDIEELDRDGFTITSAPGFHMGHIAFNIRPNQSYRYDRPARELPYVAAVLSDVNFRHAIFHAYNQEGIIASLYGYAVKPIQSLVPPAQGAWLNPVVPKHPYNPGDPFGTTVYNPVTGEYEDSCSILRYGGYTFVDADSSGTVTSSDYWAKSGFGGTPLPTLRLLTPSTEVAPTSALHGARLITSLHNIGLNNMVHWYHWPYYIIQVFQNVQFDMYMAFWGLGKFPDHLYDMLHSSQDAVEHPWRYNAPGVNDAYVDQLVETVKFSPDHAAKLQAAWELQDWLYSPDSNLQALAYMQMYSRVYFSAFSPGLRGVMNSPGYGSSNSWTYMNMYWEPSHPNERVEDGKSTVIWSLDEEPERLNPTYTLKIYEQDIMGRIFDPLVAMNPYTNDDLPWLAESWELVEDPDGVPGAMNVTFHLRPDITWQDGMPFTAEDARFNWLFLRDNAHPLTSGMWTHIVDVEIVNTYTVKVVLDVASQWLLYDLSETAALLPPPVWAPWNGKPLDEILGRIPSMEVGPQPDPEEPWYCPTNLYGTGPFTFNQHDPTLMHYDLLRNPNYFKTTDELSAQIVILFHQAGDVNSNGLLDGEDLSRVILAFSSRAGDPNYDVDADMNQDGNIDMRDLSQVAYLWGKKREYP